MFGFGKKHRAKARRVMERGTFKHYRAVCKCGWAGPTYPKTGPIDADIERASYFAAQGDADNHEWNAT